MISIPSILASDADASMVPDWIKNTAKWYGDGDISEDDFLNAIKYLIQQKIIVISDDGLMMAPPQNLTLLFQTVILRRAVMDSMSLCILILQRKRS